MQSTLDTAQEAAIGFVRHLSAADVATVVSFDSDVEIVQDFTHDAVALQDGIRRTRAHGSTSLYNAVYIALKELNKTIRQDDSRSPRRRAIVLLSDGDDTSSLVSFDEIINLASRSDTIIYTIGLGRRDTTLSSRKYEDGEYVLRKLAQQTGGRSFFPQHARELAGVYQGIQEDYQTGPRWPTNRARSVGTESGGRFTCRSSGRESRLGPARATSRQRSSGRVQGLERQLRTVGARRPWRSDPSRSSTSSMERSSRRSLRATRLATRRPMNARTEPGARSIKLKRPDLKGARIRTRPGYYAALAPR